MKKTRILAIGIPLIFCFFSVMSFSCRGGDITTPTLYVGGTGLGNYTTIQEALDTITVGGTVYVYPGTYHENLTITTPVHLIGENTNTTIIDGDNTQYVVTLDAGNSTLSGFTIIHSKMKFPYAGIYVISDHNTITNNILTENFYGMQLGYDARENLLENNTIFRNGRCGVYFNHASYNRLIGNIVFDNPVNGFGLYEFSNNNSIMDNTFSNNSETGVNVRESYNNQVFNNTFIQNHVGFHTPAPEYHTVVRDNTFSDNDVSIEEERDAFVFTVVVFDILVFFVFLVFKKLTT
jgi:nitrous oxidase accessory protein